MNDTHQDAREIAANLKDEMDWGQITDREQLIERMQDDVDFFVNYTASNRAIVAEFGTDDYTDRFGEEGLAKDGDINWAAIAFCTVERLAYEALEDMGVDVNAPWECSACEERHEDAEDAELCCVE